MSLTTAESFAAAQVLTEWPDTYNYDQLLTAIESGCDDDVFVWEAYENHDPQLIVEIIEGIRVAFLNSVKAMTEDLCKAIEDGDQQAITDRMLALRAELGVN